VKLPWILATLGLAIVVLAFAACTSPEATRLRGQGRGGDVRNVGDVVLMHEGSDPYWRTPRARGISGPPLETARQADRLSR
jgi:hypothetical protein